MWKVALVVVLAAHGIGHSLGLFPAVGLAPTTALPKWTGESWLLPGASPSLAHAVGGLLWLVAGVGFLLLAAVVLGWISETWWQPLAIVSGTVSLLAIVVFPAGFPTLVNLIGAAAVDIAVLVATIWYEWAPSALES